MVTRVYGLTVYIYIYTTYDYCEQKTKQNKKLTIRNEKLVCGLSLEGEGVNEWIL